MKLKTSSFWLTVCALGAALCLPKVWADVTPASPFTDHMVLQRGASTPVFGYADPGEKVAVTLGRQTQTASRGQRRQMAGAAAKPQSGRAVHRYDQGQQHRHATRRTTWARCGCRPGSRTWTSRSPRRTKYYFAGTANEAQEVAAANYPQIRMFKGDWTMAYTPQRTAPGVWKVCTPENVREFSAIGYFFARDLQNALHVPVGIIAQTYGASTAEAWIRREALLPIPEMKTALDNFDAQVQAYNAASQSSAFHSGRSRRRRAPPRARDPVQNQHNPTVLYNGMIAGIVPYGIKGVIWYQGESVLNGAAGTRCIRRCRPRS